MSPSDEDRNKMTEYNELHDAEKNCYTAMHETKAVDDKAGIRQVHDRPWLPAQCHRAARWCRKPRRLSRSLASKELRVEFAIAVGQVSCRHRPPLVLPMLG